MATSSSPSLIILPFPHSPPLLPAFNYFIEFPSFRLASSRIKGHSLRAKAPRSLAGEGKGAVDDGALIQDYLEEAEGNIVAAGPQRQAVSSDSISLGIKEPVYEVFFLLSPLKIQNLEIKLLEIVTCRGLVLIRFSSFVIFFVLLLFLMFSSSSFFFGSMLGWVHFFGVIYKSLPKRWVIKHKSQKLS